MSEMLEKVAAALAEYQRAADFVGGCGDGGCVVKRPVGMHTNGGCRCSTDRMKAQRMMAAGSRLSRSIDSILSTPTTRGEVK